MMSHDSQGGRINLIVLAAILAFSAGGCASISQYLKPKRARDQELVVPSPPNRAPTPLQHGLLLTAYAKGNLVSITLANYTEVPVVAGPKCFAVIPAGTRQVIPFRIEDTDQLMPIKTLNKGEGIQGRLRFGKVKDLVGSKLVYNSGDNDIKPVFCVIQPARDGP
ncbi:MAG: hypothetical protein NTX50_28500 [Candidatus Sumerlaeota bacterium]|nr:hypothetical protein [Candidatus Sumerlaeota bacterium]